MIEAAGESTQTRKAAAIGRWWEYARTSFFWMVVIAFALRLAFILLAHTYKFQCADRADGVGATAVSVSDRWHIQDGRSLYARFGPHPAHHQ